ncbi:cyclic nucleotide-binding/CBS domain-containing protein [Candidatus Altiarchaeota archaeon]
MSVVLSGFQARVLLSALDEGLSEVEASFDLGLGKEKIELMSERGIGSVFVEVEGSVIGVMTERDVLKKVVAKGLDTEKTQVKDIMSFPIISVTKDYTVDEVVYLMYTLKIRHVVVEEDGKATGVVSVHDIIRSKLEKAVE